MQHLVHAVVIHIDAQTTIIYACACLLIHFLAFRVLQPYIFSETTERFWSFRRNLSFKEIIPA
jgi:hypothetical protein